jgi:hypothetical protein
VQLIAGVSLALVTEAKRSARPADPLEKWRLLALACFVLAWLVRGADWLLPVSGSVVVALQLLVAVPFAVAVIVLVASWLRRWGNGG